MGYRRAIGVFLLLCGASLCSGCHQEIELPPLKEQKISLIGDKFYAVKALSEKRALVVGYRGKILETTDQGQSWEVLRSGTDRALYDIKFGDDKNAWICGQSGIILHSSDGGKTWSEQKSGTNLYLFALHAIDAQHVIAVGDRSLVVETEDGGKTWTQRKVTFQEGLTADEKIAMQDPIFYDVEFIDRDRGWIVGEFGTILATSDGGRTWRQQQNSLLGAGIVDVYDIPTLFGVHMSSPTEGVAVGLEGHVAATHDGETWAFEPVKTDASLADPLYAPLVFPDGRGWVVGSGGVVLFRASGGQAWTSAKLGMRLYTWLRGIDFYADKVGWIVGGFGTILYTTDGGATWDQSL